MPTRLSWSKLFPGLIALAILVMITAGVLAFAGIGRIRGSQTHLFVLTDQARGVMRGTEVWIAGQKVGVVDGVDFRPPTNDSLGRVVIAVTVRESDANQIRQDSRAQVRSGANIIGPVVVYITSGSPGSRAAREGDTIRARAQSDLALATTKMTLAMSDIRPVIADVRTVMTYTRSSQGTLGALRAEGLGGNVTRFRAQMSRIRMRMNDGAGEAMSAFADLTDRSRIALARADSIRALLGSPASSIGRFRRDSTLGETVAHVRDELQRLQGELTAGEGTLPRMQRDSALARSVADARREMSLLFADIRLRPLHYVHF